MDGDWIFEEDFESVAAKILDFKCTDLVLTIELLEKQSDNIVFGCYVPTIPRPTSILSGKLTVRRLPDHRTELLALNFFDWADPFIKALVKSIAQM
jgi:hypothetical protein